MIDSQRIYSYQQLALAIGVSTETIRRGCSDAAKSGQCSASDAACRSLMLSAIADRIGACVGWQSPVRRALAPALFDVIYF